MYIRTLLSFLFNFIVSQLIKFLYICYIFILIRYIIKFARLNRASCHFAFSLFEAKKKKEKRKIFIYLGESRRRTLPLAQSDKILEGASEKHSLTEEVVYIIYIASTSASMDRRCAASQACMRANKGNNKVGN